MTCSLPQAPQWSSLIKSGCRVFVGGNASVPHALVQHLIDNSEGFSDIELVHMLALGDTRWAKEEYKNVFVTEPNHMFALPRQGLRGQGGISHWLLTTYICYIRKIGFMSFYLKN